MKGCALFILLILSKISFCMMSNQQEHNFAYPFNLLENDAALLGHYREIERRGYYCSQLREAESILKSMVKYNFFSKPCDLYQTDSYGTNGSDKDDPRTIGALISERSMIIARSVVATAALRKKIYKKVLTSAQESEEIDKNPDILTVHGFGANGGTIAHWALYRLPDDSLLNQLCTMTTAVNVNAVDMFGETPLLYAFDRMYDKYYYIGIEVLKKFIAYGADVNSSDYMGNTLLHYSMNPKFFGCQNNKWNRVVFALVEAGADINRQNKWGDTPLHLFVSLDITSPIVLSYLLQQPHIDLTLRTTQGKTILQRTRSRYNYETIEKALKEEA